MGLMAVGERCRWPFVAFEEKVFCADIRTLLPEVSVVLISEQPCSHPKSLQASGKLRRDPVPFVWYQKEPHEGRRAIGVSQHFLLANAASWVSCIIPLHLSPWPAVCPVPNTLCSQGTGGIVWGFLAINHIKDLIVGKRLPSTCIACRISSSPVSFGMSHHSGNGAEVIQHCWERVVLY